MGGKESRESVCVCVCVSVCASERERERGVPYVCEPVVDHLLHTSV